MGVLKGTYMPRQFKMYLPEDTVAALDSAAERFNRRSGQQVAEEVITSYLSFWEQAEQMKANRIERQREQMFRDEGSTVGAKKVKPYSVKVSKKGRR